MWSDGHWSPQRAEIKRSRQQTQTVHGTGATTYKNTTTTEKKSQGILFCAEHSFIIFAWPFMFFGWLIYICSDKLLIKVAQVINCSMSWLQIKNLSLFCQLVFNFLLWCKGKFGFHMMTWKQYIGSHLHGFFLGGGSYQLMLLPLKLIKSLQEIRSMLLNWLLLFFSKGIKLKGCYLQWTRY